MLSNPQNLACATALLLGSCMLPAVLAQGMPPGPVCQYRGLEVMCAPRRITYGYYPTIWRRWPTDHFEAQPTPAAEPVETPAPQESQPKVEPGQPQITPEDETLFPSQPGPSSPGGAEPGIPQPKSPDPSLPFLDQPPEPPQDAPAPQDMPAPPADTVLPPANTTPAPGLPGAQPRIQTPPADDAPPTMPDDDPFRDDPPAPDGQDTPAAPGGSATPPATGDPATLPAPQSGMTLPEEESIAPPGPEPSTPAASASDAQAGNRRKNVDEPSQSTPLRWRRSGTAEVAAAGFSPLAQVPHGDEPGLLPIGEPRLTDRTRGVPAVAPAHSNPLRRASVAPRSREVAQTAAWSVDSATATDTSANARRNPLRNN